MTDQAAASRSFDDGKDAGALAHDRRSGAARSASSQHVLRYWEEQFPMLQPLKRSGGRRYYRPEDVALVETIDRLVHREGYTLRGARARRSRRGRAVPPRVPGGAFVRSRRQRRGASAIARDPPASRRRARGLTRSRPRSGTVPAKPRASARGQNSIPGLRHCSLCCLASPWWRYHHG